MMGVPGVLRSKEDKVVEDDNQLPYTVIHDAQRGCEKRAELSQWPSMQSHSSAK